MAAYEETLVKVSIPANADLSALQHRFMTVNASGKVAATGAGAEADGVLQDNPAAADRPASVAVSGVTKIEASGTLTAGDDVASGANGLAVTAGTGDVVNGRCLVGAADGKIAAVLLKTAGANALG